LNLSPSEFSSFGVHLFWVCPASSPPVFFWFTCFLVYHGFSSMPFSADFSLVQTLFGSTVFWFNTVCFPFSLTEPLSAVCHAHSNLALSFLFLSEMKKQADVLCLSENILSQRCTVTPDDMM